VASHDPVLNADLARGPDGRWLSEPGPPLFTLALEQLRRYDVGQIRPGSEYARRFAEQVPADGERIPTLEEVFALVRRSGNRSVGFNVETKIDPAHPGRTATPEIFAQTVVSAIRAAGLEARSTVQSFDWRTLRVAQRIAPEIATACLTVQQGADDNVQAGRAGPSNWLAGLDVDAHGGSVPRLVKAAGCAIWSPNHANVTEAALREARALGLRTIVWTVNEPKEMERLIGMGVDGIITDYPDRLRGVMERRGLALPPAVRVPDEFRGDSTRRSDDPEREARGHRHREGGRAQESRRPRGSPGAAPG
jgi:glycerophosphoryl diester phosphodiesterase